MQDLRFIKPSVYKTCCLFLLSSASILWSCKESNEILVIDKVRFSISNEVLGTSNGRKNDSSTPSALLVTIRDSNNDIVANQERLELHQFGDSFLSVPLTLSSQNASPFYLTEFLVVDENNMVKYVVPKDGSLHAHLVKDPLDIEFFVDQNEITTVTPEVIEVEVGSSSVDYGYGQFGFDVVKKIEVIFSSFIKGEANFELTDSHLKIEALVDTVGSDTTALWSYETNLLAQANKLAIRDAPFYRITVSKPGYSNWNRIKTLRGGVKVEIIFEEDEWSFEALWNKHFGGTAGDYLGRVISTTDGGILLVGETSSTDHDILSPLGGLDVWILKLNPSGGIDWSRNYGTSAPDDVLSVTEFDDGSGYFVTGFTFGYTAENIKIDEGWILKIDRDGNELWKKSTGGKRYYSSIVAIDNPDNFVVITYGEPIADSSYGSVRKLDNNGNVIWEKGLPANMSPYHNEKLLSTADGYIGTYNQSTFKLNVQGNLEWRLGGSYTTKVGHIKIFPDPEGYTVIGNQYPNKGANEYHPDYIYIAKLNNQGHITWKKQIELDGEKIAVDAIQTASGNYLITGTSYTYHNYEAWVSEITPQGELVGEQIANGISSDGYGSSRFSYMVENESNYVLMGSTNKNGGHIPGNYGGYDFWAMKVEF